MEKSPEKAFHFKHLTTGVGSHGLRDIWSFSNKRMSNMTAVSLGAHSQRVLVL